MGDASPGEDGEAELLRSEEHPPARTKTLRLALLRTCHDEHYGCFVPAMINDVAKLLSAELSSRQQQQDSDAPPLQTGLQDKPTASVSSVSVSVDDFDVETALAYPTHRAEYDGFIIPGSLASAYEDEEWIHRLRREILSLHEEKRPLLGICFGHQIIAEALGGKVQARSLELERHYGRRGFETGEGDGSGWRREEGGQRFLLYHHGDEVTRTPPEARVWGRSAACNNHGFRIGKHILTFQAHPEWSAGETGLLCIRQLLQRDVSLARLSAREGQALTEDLASGADLKWALSQIADLFPL